MSYAGIDDFAVLLDLDGKVRKAVDAALVGPVVDLPVDEAAIPGKPDRSPGADATEREADLPRLDALIE
ncbi:MAG: hypothetical protein R3A10_16510 [Caldilineaceae bacterium]